MTVVSPSSSVAHMAFERALKKYSSKEFTELRLVPTNLDDLISTASRIGQDIEGMQDVEEWTKKLANAARNLKPFHRLLEGACKLSPKGGDLIWGSILFILEMARNNLEIFTEVSNFFIEMEEEMGYVTSLETTFRHSDLVIPVIEALYVAIIGFWVEAVKYYNTRLTSKRTRLFPRLSTFFNSPSTVEKFRELIAEINRQNARLHRHMSAQHATESLSYHRHNYEENVISQRTRLKDWINAPSYERDFHVANSHRYEGTCDWIRQKVEYLEWSKQTKPFLVIYGTPGAGKTILSSWLINEVRQLDKDHLVLYHFFSATDNTKQTLVSATRAFIDQLYVYLYNHHHTSLPNLESDLKNIQIQHQRDVEYADLWTTFSSFIANFARSKASSSLPSVTILLDAMDECKGSKQFAKDLHKLVQSIVRGVRIVVTTRRTGDHISEFARISNQVLELHITPTDVQCDIPPFIQHKINKIERLRGDDYTGLRNQLIRDISNPENHQGMFLWVYLMYKEVRRLGDVDEILLLLGRLHDLKDLHVTYARICKRLTETDDYKHLTRPALQWVMFSIRPLRFAELEEALQTMRPSTKNAHYKGKRYLWSRKDIVDACGDLVASMGERDGDLIQPVHLSVPQFFHSNTADISVPTDIEPALEVVRAFLADVQQAPYTLGIACLEYLLSDSLQKSEVPIEESLASAQLVDTSLTATFPLFNYAVAHWPDHILDLLEEGSSIPDRDRSLKHHLVAKLSEFVSNALSRKWFEHYIVQLGPEAASNIIRRFLKIQNNLISNLSTWITSLVKLDQPTIPLRLLVLFRLSLIFGDEAQYKRLLTLSGDEATTVLDVCQLLLDTPYVRGSLRRQIIAAMQRLSAKTQLHPRRFVLHGNLQLLEEHPIMKAGNIADIYKATFQDETVNLKVIRAYKPTLVDHMEKVYSKMAITWGQLRHPNIVPFFGLFIFRTRLSLVSPWAENGRLPDYLSRNPSANRVLLCTDTAAGVEYLHANEIIHGELKADNILVDDSGRASLGDFSLSNITDPQILHWASQSTAASKGGSIRWQAPELHDSTTESSAYNTMKSDVYAWASLCYEIFTDHIPFFEIPQDSTVLKAISRGRSPSRPQDDAAPWVERGLTLPIWGLMEECWKASPQERPNMSAVVSGLDPEKPVDTRLPSPWKERSAMHFRTAQEPDLYQPEASLEHLDVILSRVILAEA